MSKYDEALKILIEEVDEANCEYGNIRPSALKAVRDIEELVKRATPMKPLTDFEYNTHYDALCSKCKNIVHHVMNYCDECGQAIDWGDE